MLLKLLLKFVGDLLNRQVQRFNSLLNTAGCLLVLKLFPLTILDLVPSVAPCDLLFLAHLFFAFLCVPEIPKIVFLLELSSEFKTSIFCAF